MSEDALTRMVDRVVSLLHKADQLPLSDAPGREEGQSNGAYVALMAAAHYYEEYVSEPDHFQGSLGANLADR
jgi:hypothetical protein